MTNKESSTTLQSLDGNSTYTKKCPDEFSRQTPKLKSEIEDLSKIGLFGKVAAYLSYGHKWLFIFVQV